MKRLAPILLFALAAHAAQPAPPTLFTPEEATALGERLRAELLAQRPAQPSAIAGLLKIRGADGARREVPVRLRTEIINDTTWRAIYEVPATNGQGAESLVITRRASGTNSYDRAGATKGGIYESFAGSDFSAADLGLEFLHWPGQRVLRAEMKSSRSCRVLESSIQPEQHAGGYARVLSWVDLETGGMVRAEAYDRAGKLAKEFALKRFQKVEGHWQLREMEMISYPHDSRTRLEFELDIATDRPSAP